MRYGHRPIGRIRLAKESTRPCPDYSAPRGQVYIGTTDAALTSGFLLTNH
jgi:hypothetical protein